MIYGNSGVMTFQCNHQGKVYEKDLGPDTPNILGGSSANYVSPDVVGATISGGGRAGAQENTVTGNFGVVGGGYNNAAYLISFIGGGSGNRATAAIDYGAGPTEFEQWLVPARDGTLTLFYATC